MAKKSSALSQPGRLRRVTSDDIKNPRWTDAERQAVRRISERQTSIWETSRVSLMNNWRRWCCCVTPGSPRSR
jgi:hypothetical protein